MTAYQYARSLHIEEVEMFEEITKEEYERIKNEVEGIRERTSALVRNEF